MKKAVILKFSIVVICFSGLFLAVPVSCGRNGGKIETLQWDFSISTPEINAPSPGLNDEGLKPDGQSAEPSPGTPPESKEMEAPPQADTAPQTQPAPEPALEPEGEPDPEPCPPSG